jgi:hypothetical protein
VLPERGCPQTGLLAKHPIGFQSFRNRQSELLAMFSIITLTIFVRQRGSTEPKPVHAPDSQTGS